VDLDPDPLLRKYGTSTYHLHSGSTEDLAMEVEIKKAVIFLRKALRVQTLMNFST
jgi:hypothetical protein